MPETSAVIVRLTMKGGRETAIAAGNRRSGGNPPRVSAAIGGNAALSESSTQRGLCRDMRTPDYRGRNRKARVLTLAGLVLWLSAGLAPAQGTAPATTPVAPTGQVPGAAANWDILGEPFPYEGKDVTMQALAKELTQKTGIPVIAPQLGGGGFAVDNMNGTVRDLLDKIEADGRALWWWDGGAIRFEPADNTTSALIPLQGVTSDELLQQVAALGIDEVKYPIMSNPDARFIRVVGPQGYVESLRELIASIAASRTPAGAPAQGAGLTIIRGRTGTGAVPAAPDPAPGPQSQQPGVYAAPGQAAGQQIPMQIIPIAPQTMIAPRTQ